MNPPSRDECMNAMGHHTEVGVRNFEPARMVHKWTIPVPVFDGIAVVTVTEDRRIRMDILDLRLPDVPYRIYVREDLSDPMQMAVYEDAISMVDRYKTEEEVGDRSRS